MLYDDPNKKWVLAGNAQLQSLSKVQIYRHTGNNTFRVVGRKMANHDVVLNCSISRTLKYNRSTAAFHQWRDQGQVYGLDFANKEDSESFAQAMKSAIHAMNQLAKQQQHAQAQPPPQQQPAMSAEPERKQTRKRYHPDHVRIPSDGDDEDDDSGEEEDVDSDDDSEDVSSDENFTVIHHPGHVRHPSGGDLEAEDLEEGSGESGSDDEDDDSGEEADDDSDDDSDDVSSDENFTVIDVPIVSARANVMLYDYPNKKWVPAGNAQQQGLSKVQIYRHTGNNTFRVVGRKMAKHDVVINCSISRTLKYNRSTATFHQWRDQGQVYGLDFANKEDSKSFAQAMKSAIHAMNQLAKQQQHAQPQPPPQQQPAMSAEPERLKCSQIHKNGSQDSNVSAASSLDQLSELNKKEPNARPPSSSSSSSTQSRVPPPPEKVQEPVTTNSLDRRQRERSSGPPTNRVPPTNNGSDSPKVIRFNSNPNLSVAGDVVDLVEPTSQTTEICIYHLRGKCGFGNSCRQHHKDSMYQWQFRHQGDTMDYSWKDFRSSANFELELYFSDVEKGQCYIEFDSKYVLQVNFEKMIGEMKNSAILEIRRLSTESSAVQKFQSLATQWKWYWRDQWNKWIIYGETNVTGYKAMVDCEILEQHYQENLIGQMKFATTGYQYVMDYNRMMQTNVVHKTERMVRRRPTLVQQSEVDTRKKKSADTGKTKITTTSMVVPAPLDKDPLSYIPSHWSFDPKKRPEEISDHFHLSACPSSSQEYKKLKKLFFETMSAPVNIIQIKRIENAELWMDFVSKREKMKRKRRGDDIAELQLFHGTNEKRIDAICKQGFDFRRSGSKTGNKYGKGSYFAKYAKIADSYTDYGVKKHMFVVRVLPGDYAPGSTSLVHPPPRNPKDPFELFDSCVDNLQNPNIYVIFTFDQVYPEYIIEYEKLGI